MVNKVILVGHLGKDPEIKYFEGGNSVARITLATSESFKDKEGNKQERTEWHNCTAWGKLAEIAEKYLKKGSLIYAEGSLQTRSWDDKDGNKKYATDIKLDTFRMLNSKRESAGTSTANEENDQNASSNVTDDLPF